MSNAEVAFRILKEEYTRTRYQVIGKARFPSLLTELWASDAIKTKTNMVKSFMKAGVFPFNPNAIDRSRILRSSASSAANQSAAANLTGNNDQTSMTILGSTSAAIVDNRDAMPADQSNLHSISSFQSSREAISALNQVLRQTTSFHDDRDSDEEDDRSLFPKQTAVAPSNVVTAARRQTSRSVHSAAANNNPSVRSRSNAKRKRTVSKIIGFDTSDEEGKLRSFTSLQLELHSSSERFKH